jgi:uncharacterized protein (TIGR03437 family)
LLYISPTQINAYFDSAAPPGPARLDVVTPAGQVSAEINLVESAPAVFTANARGFGPGLILHADGSRVTVDRPAAAGETVRILATGLGRLPQPVQVSIGGVSAPVVSATTAPMPFPIQTVEAVIPAEAPTGPDVPLEVVVLGRRANRVTIPVGR